MWKSSGTTCRCLPGVLECLAEGIASGAVERNRESSGHCLIADESVQPAMLDLCFDPQTSGGLLIAVPQGAAADLLARLHAAGMPEAAMIGRVLDTGPGRVLLRTDGRRPIPAGRPSAQDCRGRHPSSEHRRPSEMSCCEGSPERAIRPRAMPAMRPRLEQKFQEFLRRPPRRGAGRQDQAGHRHRPFGLGPLRAVREEPRREGPGDGLLAGRDRRGRLDGHLLRRIARDGVL